MVKILEYYDERNPRYYDSNIPEEKTTSYKFDSNYFDHTSEGLQTAIRDTLDELKIRYSVEINDEDTAFDLFSWIDEYRNDGMTLNQSFLKAVEVDNIKFNKIINKKETIIDNNIYKDFNDNPLDFSSNKYIIVTGMIYKVISKEGIYYTVDFENREALLGKNRYSIIEIKGQSDILQAIKRTTPPYLQNKIEEFYGFKIFN